MNRKNLGFTLLEVLLVVAIIAILAGIIIVALNPNKQLGDSRNTQRRADVNTILSAIYQYAIDNGGDMPTLSSSPVEICKTLAGSCSGLQDLTILTNSEKYLTAIPIDPLGSVTSTAYGTGYLISKSVNNRITISAPRAEAGAAISATR